MKPAEVKELKVFSGNTPKNEAYHSAYVQYNIIGSGDYFQTDHYIQHQHEQTENVPDGLESSENNVARTRYLDGCAVMSEQCDAAVLLFKLGDN